MASPNPQNTCHILPCSVEEDGKAHAITFFRPEPLPVDEGKYHAATLRGRGLLAKEPIPVHGQVLEIQQQVKVQQSFSFVQNWHHTHQTKAVDLLEQQPCTQFQHALEWIQIARVLHEPIPINQDNNDSNDNYNEAN